MGPYMVEEWIPNDRIVLAPNPNYWREGYPKKAGAELIEVAAENTRVSMMQSGELEAAREIPPAAATASTRNTAAGK
jgi:peptide/nickel transport system substrate-binding protein